MPSKDDARPPVVKAVAFQNEPHTDFSRKASRAAFQQGLDEVAELLGRECPLVIDGKATTTRKQIVSINPSHKKQTVGVAASATAEHAKQAIEAAKRAQRSWSRTPVEQRAQYLDLIASEMQSRRFALAAWMVYECGKPWVEADADVAEAIDFCRFYAAQMRELATPVQCDFPGEENTFTYRARGVAVVIAPWNFPLAILTGMAAAALVAGNTVILKPAEQSPVIAAELMEIIREVGLPDGVVNYLPGVGEEVGPVLVESPDVHVVAFTGSRQVGLSINARAADTPGGQAHVKRVIAEMGGKNAILVDGDADLDEAVQATIQSAFGYAGQKCSACSRVIVHKACYDAFLERVKRATESLKFGPAEDPSVTIGPVIDGDSQGRIRDYIAIGKDECETVLAPEAGSLNNEGFYVAPHIFANVDPDSRLARHEIFGPVLAVIRVPDLDKGIQVANNTEYALTGGIFSRSPRNLQKARQELQVGNLYINRNITGALVNRHPFGGYRLSGIGSKAGGRDYLLQFLIPVTTSENTLRRGFAPPPDDEA
jgi:RHH-type proline utilization regulon transcriptional repressor/proline dehydrogenase/delta 1-pyrroline-5-carboxylate dehydrogenase